MSFINGLLRRFLRPERSIDLVTARVEPLEGRTLLATHGLPGFGDALTTDGRLIDNRTLTHPESVVDHAFVRIQFDLGFSATDWNSGVESLEIKADGESLFKLEFLHEEEPGTGYRYIAALTTYGEGVVGGYTHGDGLNVMVMEFEVTPNLFSVADEYRPRFDIATQAEGIATVWDPPYPRSDWTEVLQFPTQAELPNYSSRTDSDDLSELGRMWVTLVAGGEALDFNLFASRHNFNTFMRVGLNGASIDSAGDVQGSQCSPSEKWQSKTTNGSLAVVPGPEALPNSIALNHFVPVDEPLVTSANVVTTTPGVRHHAAMMGLKVATVAGTAAQPLAASLVIEGGGGDVVLDTSGAPLTNFFTGKSGATRVGDLIAYGAVGYYASSIHGTIVGPLSANGTGQKTVTISHELVGGGANSPRDWTVTGKEVFMTDEPAPVATPVFGAIWPVAIPNALVPVSTTPVTIRIVDVDALGDTILDEVTIPAATTMKDENPLVGVVPAIPNAVCPVTFVGRIAANRGGEIVGPLGDSDETTTDIAWEFVDSPFTFNSPSASVTGTSYASFLSTMPLTSSTGTTIPRGTAGTTITVPPVYVEATASGPGTETATVQLLGAIAGGLDTKLDQTNVTITRPANAFRGALIGSPAGPSATFTLTNPGAGGTISGALGEVPSGTNVYYEVVDTLNFSDLAGPGLTLFAP